MDMTSITNPLPPDPAMLDRYLANECTALERQRIVHWIRANPEEGGSLERLRGVMREEPSIEIMPFEAAWETFERRVGLVAGSARRRDGGVRVKRDTGAASRERGFWETRSVPLGIGTLQRSVFHLGLHAVRRSSSKTSTTQKARWIVWSGTLATLALAVTVAWNTSPWAETGRRGAAAFSHTYATKPAQRAIVRLPRGDRMTLAPGTTVHYQIASDGSHIVDLEGEAFFTVTHSPRTHFVVRTAKTRVWVLGTSFDIRHYPNDPAVHIAVTEGRVALANARVSQILSAGHSARVADSTLTMTTDGNATPAWISGNVVLRDASVAEAVETLGRWSGYTFRFADSAIAARRVTTVLPIDHPSEAIRLLEDLLDVVMTRNGTIVTISPSRRAQKPTKWRLTPRAATSTISEVGK
jgi:ferric-dicitrate binding protein FerR (iron transport regulator)